MPGTVRQRKVQGLAVFRLCPEVEVGRAHVCSHGNNTIGGARLIHEGGSTMEGNGGGGQQAPPIPRGTRVVFAPSACSLLGDGQENELEGRENHCTTV